LDTQLSSFWPNSNPLLMPVYCKWGKTIRKLSRQPGEKWENRTKKWISANIKLKEIQIWLQMLTKQLKDLTSIAICLLQTYTLAVTFQTNCKTVSESYWEMHNF
jgi:hypothetical protein